jgi:hypothetical protein
VASNPELLAAMMAASDRAGEGIAKASPAFAAFAEVLKTMSVMPDIKPHPGAQTVFMSGRRGGKSIAMEVLKAREKLSGTDFTNVWIDELGEIDMAANAEPMSQEAISRLNELAGEMSDYFRASVNKVTLLSPGNLTVTVAGKGYSKINHIGGEEFTIDRVYVGSAKAGSRLIFAFKPVAASQYTEMEMNENEALASLDRFRMAADSACGDDFVGQLKVIRHIDSKAREAEAVKDKFNDYPEFGAW